jgi:hypothetical protein
MMAAPATVWRIADNVMLLVGDQLVQGSYSNVDFYTGGR